MYEETAECDTSPRNEPIHVAGEMALREALPKRQDIPLEFTAETETPTLGPKRRGMDGNNNKKMDLCVILILETDCTMSLTMLGYGDFPLFHRSLPCSLIYFHSLL